MTPDAARKSLDRMLARFGESCQLQRKIGTETKSVTLRASIQDYKPDEVYADAGLQVGDSKVIISTSEIDAAPWPSASIIVATTIGDPRIPIKGDRLALSNGRVRVVLAAWPAPYIGGELIRIELTIR